MLEKRREDASVLPKKKKEKENGHEVVKAADRTNSPQAGEDASRNDSEEENGVRDVHIQ